MPRYVSKCPVCGKDARYPHNPAYPFCSERCKLIDLGAWLSGRYVIPGEPVGPSPGGQADGEGAQPTEAGEGSGQDNGG